MTIDVHAHAVLPRYHQLVADLGITVPGYSAAGTVGLANPDEDARIAMMDEAGVTRQVLSAILAPYLCDRVDGARAARCLNDSHAELLARYPKRLAAYAALPLPHIDAALAELAYCLDELGTVGVALQCSCMEESVASERFDPLYEELNRREAVVFFHPCVNGLCSPLVTGWRLEPTAGAVFEDTAIALHLISRQLPHRFPNIKFIIPHLGGALPLMLNRLDNQLPISFPDLSEQPSTTARRFYYDSVAHGSRPALRCAADAFGGDRILAGSDYPVLLAFESYRDTFDQLGQAGLADSVLHDILTGNANALFKQAWT